MNIASRNYPLPRFTFAVWLFVGQFGAGPLLAQTAPPTPEIHPATPVAQTDTLALELICRGDGDRREANFGSGLAFSGNHTATAFGSSMTRNQFDGQLGINIAGDVAKAKMPRRLVPILHSSKDGWYAIIDLVVTPDEISGKIALNFNEHPNIQIDRRTGHVAIDGKIGSFSGQCSKVEPGMHAF